MKLYRINALLLKNLYITKNRLDRIFDVFYWPFLDLFLWGFATYFFESISKLNLMSVLLGGVVLWVFVWRASQDLCIYVLEDFWGRNLYNMFVSPITSLELIFSVVIFAFFRSILSFVLMLVIGYLFYSLNLFSVSVFPIAVFIAILMLMGWVLGLVVVGLIFRYGYRIQVFAWSLGWLLQPFSCVFYPLSSLPLWAQKIAVVLPTTHVFEGLRAVFFGTPVLWNNIVYSFIITIILLIIVAFFLMSSLNYARNSGLLAKFN